MALDIVEQLKQAAEEQKEKNARKAQQMLEEQRRADEQERIARRSNLVAALNRVGEVITPEVVLDLVKNNKEIEFSFSKYTNLSQTCDIKDLVIIGTGSVRLTTDYLRSIINSVESQLKYNLDILSQAGYSWTYDDGYEPWSGADGNWGYECTGSPKIVFRRP